MDKQATAKHIAFDILNYLVIAGLKIDRYIYTDGWRNQSIDISSEKLGISINDNLRTQVEQELKAAWQRILTTKH